MPERPNGAEPPRHLPTLSCKVRGKKALLLFQPLNLGFLWFSLFLSNISANDLNKTGYKLETCQYAKAFNISQL